MKIQVSRCAVVCALLIGCRSQDSHNASTAASSGSKLSVVDTIRLESDAETFVARISGVAFGKDSMFYVSDVSQGNVKKYGPRGELLQTIGRKGEGPGEFLLPRQIQVDRFGRLLVVDNGASRLSVFNSDGSFSKVVSLAGLSPVMGFVALDNDQYAFTAFAPGDSVNVLFVTDTLGRIQRSLLPIAKTIPQGQKDTPMWRSIRQFFLTRHGEQLAVIATLSDSLWMVNAATGEFSAIRLEVPGYVAPTLPAGRLAGAKGLAEWAKSFYVAAPVQSAGSTLLVTYVRGVLNYGDPAITIVQSGSRWSKADSTAPIIASRGAEFVGLWHPNSDTVVLSFHRAITNE